MPLSEKARVEVFQSDLPKLGLTIRDRVNLIYTDAPFAFDENFQALPGMPMSYATPHPGL